MANLLSSLETVTLDLPPSCIAFCPTLTQYFVVGTYYLHPEQQGASATRDGDAQNDDDIGPASKQQQRSGSLILFRIHEDGMTIRHVLTRNVEFAVLDAQWTPHTEQLGELLAVATSTGLLEFYRLEVSHDDAHLDFSSSKAVADPDLLVLSLAWHPWRASIVGVTLSNGDVCLCESAEGQLWGQDGVVHVTAIHHHDLEAWTMAFSGTDRATAVLSGGDDVVLQCSSFQNLQETTLLWKDRKLHQAGITAILPLTPDLMVTGSYDDHIRLISIPQAARRQVLAELNLGGGVWRLRLLSAAAVALDLPDQESSGYAAIGSMVPESLVFLASCMHVGARVVRLHRDGEDGEWEFKVVARFEEHKSMNYGCDVQPSNYRTKYIVSTSFYDKLLCLWKFDFDRTKDSS